MNPTVKFLLTSRRVWIAALGVVTAIVSHYAHVPLEVWVPIEGFLLALIGAFTADDTAATKAGVHNITGNPISKP